ncbi:MAG: hypothetical protein AAFP68_08240 [Pseudomonadota bacterium]
MNGEFASLRSGDILIFEYSRDYWHTALMVSDTDFVHATAPGEPLERKKLADEIDGLMNPKGSRKVPEAEVKKKVYAFRYAHKAPPNMNGGPTWAEIAAQWATKTDKGIVTTYAAYEKDVEFSEMEKFRPRHKGVEKGDFGDDCYELPFGPDALRRTLKWVSKNHNREAFSVNRGTTCCAFVIASVQTAFVADAFNLKEPWGQECLKNTLSEMDGIVGEKKTSYAKPLMGHAKRDVNNRVPDFKEATALTGKETASDVLSLKQRDANSKVETIWNGWLNDNYWVPCEWSKLGMPPSVMHDAKFMFSKNFYKCLKNDTANWAEQ